MSKCANGVLLPALRNKHTKMNNCKGKLCADINVQLNSSYRWCKLICTSAHSRICTLRSNIALQLLYGAFLVFYDKLYHIADRYHARYPVVINNR